MNTEMRRNLDATHDSGRKSWVVSANLPGTDFPIQNLPFGVFAHGDVARGGVALGDMIIDLGALLQTGLLPADAQEAAGAAAGDTIQPVLALAPAKVVALRRALSDLFQHDTSADRAKLECVLVPMAEAEMRLPLKPAAFTDFCTSIDHIARMGRKAPGLASMSLPVAYNGRASSVATSGTPVIRPRGQFEIPAGSGEVIFGPEPMLDFELEFGAWLRGGNALGQPLTTAEARDAIFGCCLVNDWSARGIQFFEAVLGPHLGKSFLTTVSPWIVTAQALEPFRIPVRPRKEDEAPAPAHLTDATDSALGGYAIELTAELAAPGVAPVCVTQTNVSYLFWTLSQMVAHQASNGAPIECGDLIGTGTVSGPDPRSRACLAEITLIDGERLTLADGSERTMLLDGDTLSIRGRAVADGFISIGFGECAGTIHPARSS